MFVYTCVTLNISCFKYSTCINSVDFHNSQVQKLSIWGIFFRQQETMCDQASREAGVKEVTPRCNCQWLGQRLGGGWLTCLELLTSSPRCVWTGQKPGYKPNFLPPFLVPEKARGEGIIVSRGPALSKTPCKHHICRLPPGLSSHFHKGVLGLSEAKEGAWVLSERQRARIWIQICLGLKAKLIPQCQVEVGEEGREDLSASPWRPVEALCQQRSKNSSPINNRFRY